MSEITPEETSTRVQALRAYSYKTECDSLFYPFLKKHWYTPVLERTPLWVAPNAITFIGFLLSVFSFFACIAYVYEPRWNGLLVIAALFLWSYQTLDNVDGPQARRTGTSGPLGELLDHGFDAFTCFLVPLGLSLALGMQPIMVLIFTGISAIAFWATMWEQYQTGTMVTAWLSDVEGIGLTALFILTGGIFGGELLSQPLFAHGPSLLEGMIALGIPGFGWQILACLRRGPNTGEAWRQAMPVIFPQALLMLWYSVSGGSVSVGLIGFLMGTTAARSSIEAILARLYKTPLKTFDPLSLAVAGVGLTTALVGEPVASWQTPFAIGASIFLCLLLSARAWRETLFITEALGIKKVFALPGRMVN